MKTVTKTNYGNVLFVIASSKVPLSSYQVKVQLKESRYVYKMIKTLAGLPENEFVRNRLRWILSSPNYRGVLQMLNKTQRAYFKKIAPGPRFLEITVDPKNNLNRRKWKYSLNFRGFLLYLLSESHAERANSLRIRQVLSNAGILAKIPFLKTWHEIEKTGFNVIDTLLAIADEFQSQLTRDEDYLLQRATERYFTELENYLEFLQSPLYFRQYARKVNPRADRKIREYRMMMLTTLRNYMQSDINEINMIIEVTSTA